MAAAWKINQTGFLELPAKYAACKRVRFEYVIFRYGMTLRDSRTVCKTEPHGVRVSSSPQNKFGNIKIIS
jgi:hypothetical protein